MTVASHSSYQNIVGSLKGRQSIIYGYVRGAYRDGRPSETNGATYSEIVELTGLKVNVVTGRISELADAGLIKAIGMRGGQTVWAPSAADEVDALKAKRRDEKAGAPGKVIAIGSGSITVLLDRGWEDFRDQRKVKVLLA